ncbi:hypothetical protein PSTG_10287 [Puccinia striiformis f. sp. tritici PST-78]|uniref:Uncharacterized protein n=1 Tax=Puccinia striiformis f. sp. tritici PST-78 TaxID=1165861 RepID=A0A0L0VB09_9BASI|nr:hypothetical protein PSTG_10287 [Puccinia striiformis f. sp. tritici PST-78]
MAVQRRRVTQSELKALLEQRNPHSRNGQNYSRVFFKQQWAAQRAFQADHTDAEEARMRKMVAIYERENVIDLVWAQLQNPRIFRATESEVRDLINAIEAESEALKEDITNLLGEDMPDGDAELFVQAVHLRAERQPVLDTKTGPRLGTKLEEKIFKAQNDRKPAVMKMITEYNVQYSEYKSTRLGCWRE